MLGKNVKRNTSYREGAGGLFCIVSSETGGNQEGLAYPIANFLSSRSYPTRTHWLKLYYSYYFKNKNLIFYTLYVHLEAYIVLKAYFQRESVFGDTKDNK